MTETRAFTRKGEVTNLLRGLGIDAASFGHESYGRNDLVNDIRRLSKAQKQKLVTVKAIDSIDDLSPNWSVQKRYYWSQTFPAHATVHIRHEYTPVLGNTNSVRYGLFQSKEDPDSAKELNSLCLEPGLKRTLTEHAKDELNNVPFSYVDFILTTANTWKTPIEDFTLIVERPHPEGTAQNFVSFCWNGPTSKVDTDHFMAHTTNLIPKKELRIGFISVYKGKN